MEGLIQAIVNGFMVGMVYALLAVGIVLIYRATGVFNFAIGSMTVFGAYTMITLYTKIGLSPWLSLLILLACGALLGLAIERAFMRPLIAQPVLAAVIATLALTYLLNGIATGIWGTFSYNIPRFLPMPSIYLGSIVFPAELLWLLIISSVVIGAVILFTRYSRIGIQMRATCESHIIAESRGINVGNIFSLVWIICGMLAMVAGLLLGIRLGVHPFLSEIAFKCFPAVIFGGLESLVGALIGGILVGVLENLAGYVVASWVMEITPYVILLLVLIFKPFGLFGWARIERI